MSLTPVPMDFNKTPPQEHGEEMRRVAERRWSVQRKRRKEAESRRKQIPSRGRQESQGS